MRQALLVLTFIFNISTSAQDVQLTWQKDMSLATEIAKSENKPVLIYFTKNDCQVCQTFYNDFFKQDTFKKIADHFVLFLLDGSSEDMNTNDLTIINRRRLAMNYNKSSSFPAVLTIDKDKMEIGEILTAIDQESIQKYWSFLETLK